MSRSHFVLLSSCVFVALLLSSGVAIAEPTGRYPFHLEGVGWQGGSDTLQVREVGVLEFDGLGTLSGSRVFIRTVSARQDRLHQTLTGTYTVNAAGILSIALIAETTAVDMADVPSDAYDLEETCHGVATADESEVLLTCELVSGASLQRAILSGAAVRDSEPDDDELDLLREDVESLSIRLCEVLRLLHVPQGQRESTTIATEDACGSTFAWNGEGPRRGR